MKLITCKCCGLRMEDESADRIEELEAENKRLRTLIASCCDPADATEDEAIIIQECWDEWEEANE